MCAVLLIPCSCVITTSSFFTLSFYKGTQDTQNFNEFESILLSSGDLWTSADGHSILPVFVGAKAVNLFFNISGNVK
jgi:hypothetical protein